MHVVWHFGLLGGLGVVLGLWGGGGPWSDGLGVVLGGGFRYLIICYMVLCYFLHGSLVVLVGWLARGVVLGGGFGYLIICYLVLCYFHLAVWRVHGFRLPSLWVCLPSLFFYAFDVGLFWPLVKRNRKKNKERNFLFEVGPITITKDKIKSSENLSCHMFVVKVSGL